MKRYGIFLMMMFSAPAFAAWTPPIGIPVPPFGINEQAPAVPNPWTASTPGFYYVQEGAGCSDATNGFPGHARCTIPGRDGDPLPAGSVVEVHGPYSMSHTSPNDFHGNGTAAAPIFIRGTSPTTKPTFTESFDVTGSHYVIVENIDISGGLAVTDKNGLAYNSDHISFRGCDVHAGGTGVSAYGPSALSNIVLYNNQIHDNGDWLLGTPGHPCDGPGLPICDQDAHGTAVGTQNGGNVSYVWLLDNTYYHNSGDGIQINGATPAAVHHIFIGRNVSHHNKQSGMWTKSATDVIFSQNTVFGIVPSASSAMGAGMGWQYEPANVWFLFNHVYDTYAGIGGGSSNDTNPAYAEPVFLIGNVIHNIHSGANYCDGKQVDSWCDAGINLIGGKERWVIGNTLYDVDSGIHSGAPYPVHLYNNIVSNVSQARGFHALVDFADRNLWDIRSNLFYENGADARFRVQTDTNLPGLQSTYSSKASNNLNADPLFANAAGGDFHLSAGSPAIDSAIDLSTILWNGVPLTTAFKQRYGVDLTVDAECIARPQGSGWDRGAYEYNPGGAAGVCPVGEPPVTGGPSGPLPMPTLRLPAYLPVNGQITVQYPSGYSLAGFVWAIYQSTSVTSQASALNAAAASFKSLGKNAALGITANASSAVFGTTSNTADLAPQQLSTGTYTVLVAAVDTNSNVSPVAQGVVTLVLGGDLGSVRVFPNPWRSDRNAGKPVTFDTLPVDATVKIFTVSGHWIKTLPAGPTTTWDLKTDSGDKAASGLYLYLITSGSGKKTGQIAVIK